MIRKSISLALLLTLFLTACSLPSLPGLAPTATVAPPPTDILATEEVMTETPTEVATPEETTTEAPTEVLTEEPTEVATEEAPAEPTEAPELDLITPDDAPSLVLLKELEATDVSFVAISPLADTLASAEGNSIVLYNMPWPAGVVKLEGHTGKVTSLSWSPDGTQLVSSSDDGTVRLWDVEAGQELSKFDIESGPQTVSWSSDGVTIAVGAKNGAVELIDGQSGDVTQNIKAADAPITAITWSWDGSQFATATSPADGGPGEIQQWDAETGEPALNKPISTYLAPGPTGIAWSPQDDIVAWVNNKDKGHATLWVIDDEQTAIVHKEQEHVTSIAWAPDADMIASAGSDNNIQVWNVEDGSKLATLEGHKAAIHTVAWALDGSFIVSADTGSIKIWGVILAQQ